MTKHDPISFGHESVLFCVIQKKIVPFHNVRRSFWRKSCHLLSSNTYIYWLTYNTICCYDTKWYALVIKKSYHFVSKMWVFDDTQWRNLLLTWKSVILCHPNRLCYGSTTRFRYLMARNDTINFASLLKSNLGLSEVTYRLWQSILGIQESNLRLKVSILRSAGWDWANWVDFHFRYLELLKCNLFSVIILRVEFNFCLICNLGKLLISSLMFISLIASD